MKNIKIEEFRGDHNKLYLTMAHENSLNLLFNIAKKRFKVANKYLLSQVAWIYDDYLYLDYPFELRGKLLKAVWVVYIDKTGII